MLIKAGVGIPEDMTVKRLADPNDLPKQRPGRTTLNCAFLIFLLRAVVAAKM